MWEDRLVMCVGVFACVNADLKTLYEKREHIQDTEADFCGDVAFQQSLMVDLCFRWPRPLNKYTQNNVRK